MIEGDGDSIIEFVEVDLASEVDSMYRATRRSFMISFLVIFPTYRIVKISL